ncbi:3-dehydroquinate synthase [Staphylococcus carnosus]|uniref:3-dehydroquinate synthase n=1 Tax=Staphylococcus carnosus TaxID=1281 RepID=UPI000CD12624|nr:3-dehydroquinate synthase [Staphylococcus carnosus]PNZ98426.1 3-dehydroquinate synthase [Staphylococcus carnosus]QRQ05149.1 3-dehydroquinate synthase [Staphylococcus carnosus]GEP78437.1 3-dehydroquinate synthase [Staphylococcus carnosus]SUM06375.1 3-dehydroquinate synthase [Staphylococcus carnosus]
MELMTTYKSNNYPIIIKNNAITELTELLKPYRDVVFIVDKNVEFALPEKIQQALSSTSSEQFTHILKVEGNETTKTFAVYQHIIEELLEQSITRNTCIIAIGGGVTGDFAGFVAATILRGVDFIQVPTTILAHDSSVGGKVGINTPQGKNLVGAFYRPTAVLYDLDFLNTLPYTEISSGYAEVYKHALLNGEEAQLEIETAFPDKKALESLVSLDKFLLKGIQTKLNIVIEDEHEQGKRKFLNLGHTFGHAIEYNQKIPHGHAVMIGILYQFMVANELLNTQFDIMHYINYFKNLDYPLEKVLDTNFEPLLALMSKDKKNDKSGIQMVLLKEIGKPKVIHVNNEVLEKSFATLQNYLK